MDIIVKDLGSDEEKSVAQKEQEILDKAANNEAAETKVEEAQVVEATEATPQKETSEEPKSESQEEITQSSELSEEDVLSFIKNRYDKDVASVGDLSVSYTHLRAHET